MSAHEPAVTPNLQDLHGQFHAAIAPALNELRKQVLSALVQIDGLLAGPSLASALALRESPAPASRRSSSFSSERDDLLNGQYPRVGASADLLRDLNALPGPPISVRQLKNRAAYLKLKVADQSAIIRAALARRGVDEPLYTPERDAVLARDFASAPDLAVLMDSLNALPGRKFISISQIRDYAKVRQIHRRPHSARRNAERLSDDRMAILRRDFPAGVASALILQRLNALPGGDLTPKEVANMATHAGLKRPPGFNAHAANVAWFNAAAAALAPEKPVEVAAAAALVPKPVAEQIVAAKPTSSPVIAKPAARPAPIAAPGPMLTGRSMGAPFPTRAQLTRAQINAQIAEHIARKGVTKCPIAAAEATTAAIPAEDAETIRRHTEARNAATMAGIEAKVARIKANRLAKLNGTPLQDTRS